MNHSGVFFCRCSNAETLQYNLFFTKCMQLGYQTEILYVTTMVIPILEYASIVWGDKNNKVLMDSIQVLQSKAAKLILDRSPYSSSSEALSDLNWMNLSVRRQMQRCIHMYNLVNDNSRKNIIVRGRDI